MKKQNVYGKTGQCFCLSLMLLLTACLGSTPPVEFYTLTSLAGDGAVPPEKEGKFSVGVGPLEIPKVLDRSQIVTRSDENRLQMAEFHRWGGSLSDDFLRVLAENLSVLLHSDQVLARPWRDFFDPRYRVSLKVHQFYAQSGREALLSVTWVVTDTKRKNINILKKSVFTEKISGKDYRDIVSAQSRLLLRLSQEIAGAIQKQHS